MCLSFDLYDTDHNGELSLTEADFMIEDVFGPAWESNLEARMAYDWVHRRDSALFGAPEISIDDWATFVSANLSAVAKVLRTRLVMQNKV